MRNSRKIQRMLTVLLAVLLIVMTSAPAMAASFKARINSNSAKVYNVPSTSSKTFVDGGRNITVTVTGYANGWARIEYKGHTGYTRVSNLNLVNPPKGYARKSTPVYRDDSSSSGRIGKLSTGKAVYVVGVSGDFYRVQNMSGTLTGYVRKGSLATRAAMEYAYKLYLASMSGSSSGNSSSGGSSSSGSSSSGGSTSSGGSSSSGSSSSGGSTSDSTTASNIDKVISLAKALVGRPYAANATPPSSFNCSAYVKYCMEPYGYDMKSTAADQAKDSRYALIDSISDLKKGDILFFDTDEDGTVDHSAIYIGGNTFWEASQVKKKVQENTLDDWYKEHFICARRPS